jgi:hypothetical protein
MVASYSYPGSTGSLGKWKTGNIKRAREGSGQAVDYVHRPQTPHCGICSRSSHFRAIHGSLDSLAFPHDIPPSLGGMVSVYPMPKARIFGGP